MSPGYQKIKSFKEVENGSLCCIRQQHSDLQIDKVNSTQKIFTSETWTFAVFLCQTLFKL